MTTPSPYILYAFSGPAWALRARLRFALDAPPPPTHQAVAETRCAVLEARWWAGDDVWRYETAAGALWARKLSHAGMQALQRCIRMEVERD